MGSNARKKMDSVLDQTQCKVCYGIVNYRTGLACNQCSVKMCSKCYGDFEKSELSKQVKTPCCNKGDLLFMKDLSLGLDAYAHLRFRCKFKGCDAYLTYHDVVDPALHSDCLRKRYQCTFCNTIVLGQQKLAHQIRCNQPLLPCPRCQTRLPERELQSHRKKSCCEKKGKCLKAVKSGSPAHDPKV